MHVKWCYPCSKSLVGPSRVIFSCQCVYRSEMFIISYQLSYLVFNFNNDIFSKYDYFYKFGYIFSGKKKKTQPLCRRQIIISRCLPGVNRSGHIQPATTSVCSWFWDAPAEFDPNLIRLTTAVERDKTHASISSLSRGSGIARVALQSVVYGRLGLLLFVSVFKKLSWIRRNGAYSPFIQEFGNLFGRSY